MPMGLSRENSLEIDKILEYFRNNDFFFTNHAEMRVKWKILYPLISLEKNVPPLLKQVALFFIHSKN